MAMAGVALLLLAIGAAGSVRAGKYQRLSAADDRRLEAIYAELFPGTPVPVAIRSRLASEARLASPDRAGATPAVTTPTTTRILVNCLARIAGEARASVSETSHRRRTRRRSRYPARRGHSWMRNRSRPR